jgi:hydrogenase maturation protein HypF
VLTSGNTTDEPIAIDDADAQTRLGSIADAFLTHDRSILRRADDSVAAVFDARAMLWRRARGFAPRPIRLAGDGPTVLAVGAELKSTICVTRGADAFVSPHLGDLEHLAAYDAFRQTVDSFMALLGVRPDVVVHDLHPRYLSTAFAAGLEQEGVRLIGVQHHHAHVAACMAEHHVSGPVIGVAFDGIGYGSDGTLWGGEFLVADLDGFERAGFLAPVPLPGGVAAVRQPWRMALAHLEAAFGTDLPRDLQVVARNAHHWEAVSEVARQPTLSPSTHGVGRLFDAVASLVGLRDVASFEGQAAIMLEQLAASSTWAEPSAFAIVERGTTVTVDPAPAIRAIVEDLRRGRDRAEIAAGFHMGLADATSAAVSAIGRTRSALDTVVLTGGVFQNRLLLQLCRAELRSRGFNVIVPSQVPAGDGGISLGQAAIGRRTR